jgi:hypothetical protein
MNPQEQRALVEARVAEAFVESRVWDASKCVDEIGLAIATAEEKGADLHYELLKGLQADAKRAVDRLVEYFCP